MKKISAFVTVVSLTAMLSGCSTKPPGCGDEATKTTIKNILATNSTKKFEKSLGKDDPEGLLGKFFDEMEVNLSQIVSEGYDESAKKQSCRSVLSLKFPTGDSAERQIRYTTQVTEDKEAGSFLLEVVDFEEFFYYSAMKLEKYYESKRWSGNWNGLMECEGIDDTNQGPYGPYSMPVTVEVDGLTAKLNYSMPTGFEDSLSGKLTTVAGIVRTPPRIQMYSSGSKSPDEKKWATKVSSGVIIGQEMSLNAEIIHGMKVHRVCTINTVFNGPALSPSNEYLDAIPFFDGEVEPEKFDSGD